MVVARLIGVGHSSNAQIPCRKLTMNYWIIAGDAAPTTRLNLRCLFLFLPLCLVLLYIGLHPNPGPFANLNNRQLLGIRGDHYLHVVAFFLVSLVGPAITRPPLPVPVALALLLVMAVGSEVVQGLMPWRQFDWVDVVANLVGIALGYGLRLLVVEKRWQRAAPGELVCFDDIAVQ